MNESTMNKACLGYADHAAEHHPEVVWTMYGDSMLAGCFASLPDADWFAGVICEARNDWHEHHEMNFLEDNGPHPDDYIGSRVAQALRDLYDPAHPD